MSGFLIFLYVLAILAGLVSWIWLVSRAFQKSVGWGLGMFFFTPLVAIIMAVQEWSEWKKPFLIYFGSNAAQIVFLVLWFVSMDPMGQMVTAMENSGFGKEQAASMIRELESKGHLTRDEREQLRYLKEYVGSMDDGSASRTGSATTSTTAPQRLATAADRPSASHVARQARRTMPIRPRLQKITLDKASSHVGKEVRLESNSGKLYRGTLTQARSGRLWVEFYVGGGTVELEFRPHEIRSLKVRM